MGGGNPAIPPALYCLDEYGIVGRVAEGVPEAVDGAADPVAEVHVDAIGPERLAELIPIEHFVGVAQQEGQSSKRKLLNLDLHPILPEFAGSQVGLEHSEANDGT
jgi:hypothetical protein